jgi:methyl-accepting chemotaxis protein
MLPVTIAGKITAATITAIALSTGVALYVQNRTIRDQGIELTRNTMRAAVTAAENTRTAMSRLRSTHAFDDAKLAAEAKAAADFRQTGLYRSVPVVSAWNSIQDVAAKEGFEFRVPKRHARNPKNEPTPEEASILDMLERSGQDEYFLADRGANLIVYARPIRLSADCLTCHGDPATSPTHDGKDGLGYQMEGWHEGEIHGAFVLKAHLDQVDHVASARAQAAALRETVFWMLPTGLLVCLLFLWYSRRSIIAPLGRVVESIHVSSRETSSASTQIAAASQSLAQSSTEQASTLEEISQSLQRVAEETRKAAEGVEQARELAGQTSQAAARGGEQMGQMQKAMQEIHASGESVSRITRTVDEIAFQTNILALNAAVEAARAGQFGAGFAVVADEVRNLAQRSAQAAQETAQLVGNSIESTKHGVEICAKVVRHLDEIQQRGAPLNDTMSSIAQVASAQNVDIERLNFAVAGLNGMTQALAANAEETAAASSELNAQSDSLRESIGAMSTLVGAGS